MKHTILFGLLFATVTLSAKVSDANTFSVAYGTGSTSSGYQGAIRLLSSMPKYSQISSSLESAMGWGNLDSGKLCTPTAGSIILAGVVDNAYVTLNSGSNWINTFKLALPYLEKIEVS